MQVISLLCGISFSAPYFSPSYASPPQLWKLACPHGTRESYLEIDSATIPGYCLLQYKQRKFVFFG